MDLQKKKRKVISPEARALIVDVYKFLREEYLFTMKHKDCKCDLSHLRYISRRTADATNVSLRTVAVVLSEDRKMNPNKNKVYKFKKSKKPVATIPEAEAENIRQELELMESATLAEASEEEDQTENVGMLHGPIQFVEVVDNTKKSWQPAEVKKEVEEEEIHWKEAEVKTEVEVKAEVEEDINCKEAEVNAEIKEEPISEEVDIKEEGDDYEITIEEHFLG